MINSVVQEIIPLNNCVCVLNEQNNVNGFSDDGGTFTVTSETSDGARTPEHGSYMVKHLCNVGAGTLEEGATLTFQGVKSGQQVTVTTRYREVSGQWGLNLAAVEGWSTTGGAVATPSDTWMDIQFTNTATSDNPSMRIRRLSSGSGTGNYSLLDKVRVQITG